MGQTQFHQEEADAAIIKFCGDSNWQKWVVVPAIIISNRRVTSDGRPQWLQVHANYTINGGADNLWLYVYFAQSSCTAAGKFQFNKSDCLTQMRTVLNGCDTSGLFPKHGGVSVDKCAVYRLSASPAGDPKPFFLRSDDYGEPDGMLGQFGCTDTSSLLGETCTCWFSGMKSVTAVFDKPAGGCSVLDPDTRSRNWEERAPGSYPPRAGHDQQRPAVVGDDRMLLGVQSVGPRPRGRPGRAARRVMALGRGRRFRETPPDPAPACPAARDLRDARAGRTAPPRPARPGRTAGSSRTPRRSPPPGARRPGGAARSPPPRSTARPRPGRTAARRRGSTAREIRVFRGGRGVLLLGGRGHAACRPPFPAPYPPGHDVHPPNQLP